MCKKVTKNLSHKHAVRRMFSGPLCKWISKVTVIRPYDVIQLDFDRGQVQGWVGSQLRLRLRLLEAGLFAKILAFRPVSASQHSKGVGFGLVSASLNAVFDGFGLGFGFVICFYGRFRLRFRLLGILCLASTVQSMLYKTFIHKLRFDFHLLQATLFASIRSSRNLCLFSSRLEPPAVADAANSSARHRREGAVGLQL